MYIKEIEREREKVGKEKRPWSHSPMNRKNISKPNSRIDAFKVLPNICNPFECLDNLNILNTRTKRITRSIAKDIA